MAKGRLLGTTASEDCWMVPRIWLVALPVAWDRIALGWKSRDIKAKHMNRRPVMVLQSVSSEFE
jgi:hypothetical protein